MGALMLKRLIRNSCLGGENKLILHKFHEIQQKYILAFKSKRSKQEYIQQLRCDEPPDTPQKKNDKEPQNSKQNLNEFTVTYYDIFETKKIYCTKLSEFMYFKLTVVYVGANTMQILFHLFQSKIKGQLCRRGIAIVKLKSTEKTNVSSLKMLLSTEYFDAVLHKPFWTKDILHVILIREPSDSMGSSDVLNMPSIEWNRDHEGEFYTPCYSVVVPDVWKCNYILLLHKSGSTQSIENYGGIVKLSDIDLNQPPIDLEFWYSCFINALMLPS
uniref:Uncharacterized protein n=1 Tax=Glossina austeni TaxID=7395 RepID=A0A1A9UQU5_GLOAU